VIISSAELKKLKIVDAHKKIYIILNEEMKNIIHSLEIKIN
jgi:stress-induced morphogen